jgi:cytochrome c peroxidase
MHRIMTNSGTIRLSQTGARGQLPGAAAFFAVLGLLAGTIFHAHAASGVRSIPRSIPGDIELVELPGKIGSLTGVQPLKPDVSAFIANREAARQLGKALFWDVQVGSAGTACASCHFHAGADIRVRNQVNPGIKGGDGEFNARLPGASPLGPNKTLTAADFPLHRLENPNDRESRVLSTTDDVISSQGSLGGDYISSTRDFLARRSQRPTLSQRQEFLSHVAESRLGNETCGLAYDPAKNAFHTDGRIHRRVEPRQTPTTVNAVFNIRQFWDGRANSQFNGVDPFGARTFQLPTEPNGPGNPDARKAGTVVLDSALSATGPQLRLTQILIDNASLASQAVGPALSDFEMSCGGKTFPDLGHKLLPLRALATQHVARDDSVLKGLASDAKGLSVTYRQLVEKAFHPAYWASTAKVKVTETGDVVADASGHSQMELNFSLFWGLAVQEYESLLISDNSPFDRYADGDETAMSTEAKAGQFLFLGKGGCVGCHSGPVFSSATFALKDGTSRDGSSPKVLERMRQGTGELAFYDAGFYNIGVRPTAEDPGNGATDPYGFDLSFARQYKWQLLGQAQKSPDRFDPTPCKWLHQFWPCADVPMVSTPQASERDAADGAFKTPVLRNVGLNPPYFHNGGQATLKDVVRYYNRGGDRRGIIGTDTSRSPRPNAFGQHNATNLAPDIGERSDEFPGQNNALGMTETEMDYLVQFLLSLTDDRVACHSGVFDHPELPLSMGHDEVTQRGTQVARDIIRTLPATGAGGFKAIGRTCLPNSGDLFGSVNKADPRPLQTAFNELIGHQATADGKRTGANGRPQKASASNPGSQPQKVSALINDAATEAFVSGGGGAAGAGAVGGAGAGRVAAANAGVAARLLARIGLVPATPSPAAAAILPDVVPLPAPALTTLRFTVPVGEIRGFEAIGFIQEANVSNDNCREIKERRQWGGSALVNGMRIVIPCNSIVQMPAATFTWAELFAAEQGGVGAAPVSLVLPAAVQARPADGGFLLPSTEMRVIGNTVAGQHIAGLVFIAQQSLNTGSGIITGFDYANGVIFVSGKTGQPGKPAVRLQLNDEKGRFSVGQSPDPRFGVDDANPTIRAQTGYPMCVPRWDPEAKDDASCPQRNRPKVTSRFGCPSFRENGVFFRAGGDIARPRPGQEYCSSFVMGDPKSARLDEPTSFEQAPFKVGDYITYSGTLLKGDRKGPGSSDTISAHTINANVGIFTAPGTLPVYLAIEEFRIGTFDGQTVINGVAQEEQDRLILGAVVTDVKSVVDIYLVDVDPLSGKETQRWVTPASMTSGVGGNGSDGRLITGGITTQFDGPVPGRVRLAAGRAPRGLLTSPTRYMRIAARSLCDPGNINVMAAPVGGLASVDSSSGLVACLDRAVAANGLRTGQYLAPVTDFIFPETLNLGDRPVPNNFWVLGFLAAGEGKGTGPLTPTPW